MANYRDFEMLNNAIQNLGEGALKRRQLDEQNRREMERMAMEREIRGAQMKLSQQAQANSQYNADRAASARAESDRMKIINDGRGDSLESEKLNLEAMKFAAGQDEKRAEQEMKMTEKQAQEAEKKKKEAVDMLDKQYDVAMERFKADPTNPDTSKALNDLSRKMYEKAKETQDDIWSRSKWAAHSDFIPKKEKPENTGTTTAIIRDDEGREIKRVTRPNEVQQILKPSADPAERTNGKPNVMGGFMLDGVPLTVPPDEEMNLIREYNRLRQSGMSPAEAEQTVKMGTFVVPVTTRIPGTPAKMGLFSMKPGTPATLQTNAFNVKTAFTPPATPAPEDIGEFPVAVPGQARREGYYKTPSGVRYWDGSAWIVE